MLCIICLDRAINNIFGCLCFIISVSGLMIFSLFQNLKIWQMFSLITRKILTRSIRYYFIISRGDAGESYTLLPQGTIHCYFYFLKKIRVILMAPSLIFYIQGMYETSMKIFELLAFAMKVKYNMVFF